MNLNIINKFPFITALFCLLLASCNVNTSSAPQGQANTITSLSNMLTGEFDSFQQWQSDRENEIVKEKAHGWINRAFIKVDAPKISDTVLVGSTRYSGPPWVVDKNEFLVWTFKKSADGSNITMSPQRFKDNERRLAFSRDAEQLAGFSPDDLEPAISGAACDIIWTKTASGFAGQSDGCRVMSVTKNKMLDWDWRYKLDNDGVFIEYSGTDDTGTVLEATPAESPYRLDRLAEDAYFKNGKALLFKPKKRSDYTASIGLLETAVTQNPQDASTKIALAYAYLKKNQYAKAQTQLTSAKATQKALSQNDELWLNALQARINDDYPKEILAWQSLLAAAPDERWAWYELASVHYRSEQYDGTVQAIESALAIEPNETAWGASYIYYLHSKSLYRLDKYTDSIKAAEPGIRNKDTQRATFYRKTMAQIAAGELDDPSVAFATYRKMSEKDGKLNEAVFETNIALLFFELGDYDTAVKHAQAAYQLSLEPYHSWALGYALTEQGNAKQGLEILTRAANQHPDTSNIMAGKGWAHYRLGQLDQALDDLKLAQKLAPRKHSGIERDIEIVQAAIANPDAEQVPAVRWFGD